MNSLQGKFKPFYKYAKSFNSDDFDYEALDNSDYVFMRWKVSTKILLVSLSLFILALTSNYHSVFFFFLLSLRSSFQFQTTRSKTLAAPPLPASITSVSRSPPPLSRGTITTGAQNGKYQDFKPNSVISNLEHASHADFRLHLQVSVSKLKPCSRAQYAYL